MEIEGGWDHLISDCHHAGDHFHRARGGNEMAHHRLDRADGNPGSILAEDFFYRPGLDGVVFLGSRAVG